MRVLLVAEAANPEWTSVPLIGWSLAKAIGQITNTHVVTQVRNREAFLNAGMREALDFTAIDTETLERPLWRVARVLRGGPGLGWTTQTAISSITYPFFERLTWRKFGADIRAHKYDVVHRITPLTPTAPSSLARRCADAGVPFVMGPLNGGVPWPAAFEDARRKEREWLSYVRGAYRLLPGARSTIKHAAAVIAGSKFTMGELPQQYKEKYFYLPENAIDPERFSRTAQPYDGSTLRVAFVGRLVPYKGPDMLLEAAAPLLRTGKLVIDVLGDGPLMPALQEFVRLEGLASAVTFHGWVPHTSVQDMLCRSHVLALPSIREFGGGVVLEAMATGVVPIVVDYAGPSELVDANTGVKIPLGDRAMIVSGFHAALASAIANPSVINELSTQGRSRVRANFTWQAKASRIVEIYRWASVGASRQSSSLPDKVLS